MNALSADEGHSRFSNANNPWTCAAKSAERLTRIAIGLDLKKEN